MTKATSKTKAAARSTTGKDRQAQIPRAVHACFFENYSETRY
jgi:hypothetical protein